MLSINAQWNSNTAQNLLLSSLNTSDIQTANTNDGYTYVAFYSGVQNNYFMYVQLLDPFGNKLFGDSGILVTPKRSGSATYVFNVCVDSHNNLIVAYQYDKSGSQTAIMNKITPNGKRPWGLNGIELGTGLSPYPAALLNNSIAVAWNNSGVINYQVIFENGIPKFPAKQINDPGNISRAQVVAFLDSSFGIIYQKMFSAPFYTHLWEQRYNPAGNPVWKQATQLTNYTTVSYRYYSVTATHYTTFIGYYANPPSQNRFDGFVQKVNSNGQLPWGVNGSDFALYSKDTQPFEMDLNLGFLPGSRVIWAVCTMSDPNQINYGISIQKFKTKNGQRLLTNTAKTVFDINSNAARQIGNLSLCNNQPIFIFYDATKKLYATKLQTDGSFAWSFIKTEIGSTTNIKGRYNFTQIVNGHAAAMWQENKGSGDRAYAQNIRCDGSTGPFQVLALSTGKLSGNLMNGAINLYWQTYAEINNKGFYVEHSLDEQTWNTLSFVSSKASGGNSSTTLDYNMTDIKPFVGNNYYRLKQIDNNAQITYSNVVLIKVANAFNISMQKISPNPVHNILNVAIESTSDERVTFVISDLTGNAIKRQSENISSGSNKININVTRLTPGMYLIKLVGKHAYQNSVQRFVKQ
jgi:Secretion system C-terminal sorting domain